MTNERKPRRAPKTYERLVPIILGMLALLILVLAVIIFAVLFGLWPA